jgi:hypothetical protein
MDRFDKFTDRAREVLTQAQDEAQRFNHIHIGTEHLLLGLLRVEDGLAARVLRELGVELPRVRTAVEFIMQRGDRPVAGEVGLTPAAKRVIELAIDESRRLGHRYIGTQHLLLGLVREGEGVAAGVLESFGVTLDAVRHEIVHLLAEPGSHEQGGPPDRVTEDQHHRPRLGHAEMRTWPPSQLDPAAAAYMRRQRWTGEQLVQLGGSPLVRVIAVGATAISAGVAVELVALEVRGAGLSASLRFRPADPADQTMHLGDPELTVSDDVGTAYEAGTIVPSRYGGGGEARAVVVPRPPDSARALTLSVARIVRPALPSQVPNPFDRSVEGPWEFTVSLAP